MIKEAFWDGMGLGWMVIIDRRLSKSTFGASKENGESPSETTKIALSIKDRHIVHQRKCCFWNAALFRDFVRKSGSISLQ